MSDETTDPIAAIVREAMDYAADHGRITTPEDYADRIREAVATPAAGEDEVTYPCRQCGTPRTAAEGGTTFTVCDECWDRQYGRPAAGEDRGYWWCPECLEEVDSSRIPDDAEYRDDGSVHWRVRVPVGTPSGEGEAEPDAYLVEFRRDDGQWGPVVVTARHGDAQRHITGYGDRGRIVPLYRAARRGEGGGE